MGKLASAVIRIAIIGVLSFPMLSAQNVIHHSVKIPVEFRPALSLDRWDNGYWIQYERSVNPGDHPSIWMYDRDGNPTVAKTDIWFPGSYNVRLLCAAAVGDGSLVASVEAWKSPGEVSTMLVRVKPPGRISDVYLTSRFAPDSIVVRNRSEIWAFGGDPVHSDAPSNPDTLERFSIDAKLLSKGLPAAMYFSDADRSSVLPSKVQSNGYRPETWVTYHGQAVVLDDGIGFVSPMAAAWIELGTDGSFRSRVSLASPFATGNPAQPRPSSWFTPPVYHARSIASAAGAVFGELYYSPAHPGGPAPPYGLFRLDREAGRWVPPAGPPPEGYGGIFGADGADLILRSGCCTYAWVDSSSLR
jgi:hypothetical protein